MADLNIDDSAGTIPLPVSDNILNEEEMKSSESGYDEAWGTRRRLALIALCRSKEQLVKGFSDGGADGADTLLSVIE